MAKGCLNNIYYCYSSIFYPGIWIARNIVYKKQKDAHIHFDMQVFWWIGIYHVIVFALFLPSIFFEMGGSNPYNHWIPYVSFISLFAHLYWYYWKDQYKDIAQHFDAQPYRKRKKVLIIGVLVLVLLILISIVNFYLRENNLV